MLQAVGEKSLRGIAIYKSTLRFLERLKAAKKHIRQDKSVAK